MPPPLSASRTVPLPATAGLIAPHQLWTHLTPPQQQQVRQVLIALGQQLLAERPGEPQPEESNHEHRS